MRIKVFIFILVQSATHIISQELKYSYRTDSPKGPALWGQNIAAECDGSRQSPININTADRITRQNRPRLQVKNWATHPMNITITNNRYNVYFTFGYPANQLPTVYGGPLKSEYELVELHFHFGRNTNAGSEHVFNNRDYQGEEHVVMKNTKYTMEEALQNEDGLVVLTRLLSFRREDIGDQMAVHLAPIFQNVRMVNTVLTIYRPVTFSLQDIFGRFAIWGPRYYAYEGSLTVPDCNQAVVFLIPDLVLKIRQDDWEAFQQVLGYEMFMAPNVRPLQKRNSRPIFYFRDDAFMNAFWKPLHI